MTLDSKLLPSLPDDKEGIVFQLRIPISPTSRRPSFRDRIRCFTPNWFYVVMGVAIIGFLFYQFPYGHDSPVLKACFLIAWFTTVALFFLFTFMSIARVFMFPDVWRQMFSTNDSLYLACVPMAMVPILNGMSVGIYGWLGFHKTGWLYFTLAAWFFSTIVGFTISFSIFHLMITRQVHSIDKMSCAWMAPFASLVVDASGGALIVPLIKPLSPNLGLFTATWALLSLIVGAFMCLLILPSWVQHLVTKGYPSPTSIFSSFIPLGALSQTGCSLIVLGEDYATYLPYGKSEVLSNPAAPEAVLVVFVGAGFLLWIAATAWLIFAVMAVVHVCRRSFTFSVATWSFVFPLGVYSAHTVQLARAIDSDVFRVLGAIFSIITTIIALVMWVYTVPKFIQGVIFEPYPLNDMSGVISATSKEQESSMKV